MPLVSHEWASALSGHSFAWEDLVLSHPPQDWSKLVGWAATHCKHTHQLTLEDLKSGNEEALQKLLACSPALRSLKLAGGISGSPALWSHLLAQRLQHLHIELDTVKQADIDSMSLMQGLKHLSLQVSKPSQTSNVHIPGQLTTLTNLTSLALRNVSVAQGAVSDSFTKLSSLQDLTLIRSRISQFDFCFSSLQRLSSLLVSEDHRTGQVLSLPGLSELPTMRRLSISSGLENFPDGVLGVTSLTSLDLGWNKFRMLPDGPYLRNLRELQFQERPSVLDARVLEKAVHLSLLSLDATHMTYKEIIALVMELIRRLPKVQRVVLLKASYNGEADREDQIAQSFLQLVNVLGEGKSIQIQLEHKWRPLLWSDVTR